MHARRQPLPFRLTPPGAGKSNGNGRLPGNRSEVRLASSFAPICMRTVSQSWDTPKHIGTESVFRLPMWRAPSIQMGRSRAGAQLLLHVKTAITIELHAQVGSHNGQLNRYTLDELAALRTQEQRVNTTGLGAPYGHSARRFMR
jgi:hypothetical protein